MDPTELGEFLLEESERVNKRRKHKLPLSVIYDRAFSTPVLGRPPDDAKRKGKTKQAKHSARKPRALGGS